MSAIHYLQMSVTETQQGAPKAGRRRGGAATRSPKRRAYVDFAPPAEADGRELLLAHLEWLTVNMDHFATQGRATLHTATLCLHKDLLLLGMIGGHTQTAQAERMELLEQRAQQYQRAICRCISSLPDVLHPHPTDQKRNMYVREDIQLALREVRPELDRHFKESLKANIGRWVR